jgi:Fe-S cluster assembly protein SufD
MSGRSLPTRKEEAWRYSDVEAAARLWPVATRVHQVPPGETLVQEIVLDADNDAIEDHEVAIGAGARAEFRVLVAGSGFGRVFVKVRLAEAAHFELAGAIVGGGRQVGEIVTRVGHNAPGGTSRQIVRAVLAGRATGNYLGKVAVARDAQRSDGSQSVKAMLVESGATANLKPELEIYADDVKCAHGASIGALDSDALFYLASRGIGAAEAKSLLLRGFVAEAFAGIADEAARERLSVLADAAVARIV